MTIDNRLINLLPFIFIIFLVYAQHLNRKYIIEHLTQRQSRTNFRCSDDNRIRCKEYRKSKQTSGSFRPYGNRN
jgi:hypothetical protein